MGDLLIRNAKMSDLEELVKFRFSFQHHHEVSNPRVWRITEEGKVYFREETEQMLKNKDGRTIVAVKDRTLVGFAYGEFIHRTTYLPNNIGRISIVYVQREVRRQGIGRRLVEELCRFFSSKNVEEVTLNYIIGNKEAEGFWGVLGFKPIRISANLRFKELEEHLCKLATYSKPV